MFRLVHYFQMCKRFLKDHRGHLINVLSVGLEQLFDKKQRETLILSIFSLSFERVAVGIFPLPESV